MKQTKRILLSLVAMLLSLAINAQDFEATGTVTMKADGEPVIGATVMEKGTSNGTITDFDGNFKLKVKQGAEIQVSYIGCVTQVLAAAQGMNIALEGDNMQLQEVVVTGYQVQRKADLTGAVSVVSASELAKQNENNPVKAMQGRVPGMNISADGNPSGEASVRIRGIGTLNNNDPLYIIDGVPTKAGMHELNGSDIESIQVLKDAASASIYGSRAANGVEAKQEHWTKWMWNAVASCNIEKGKHRADALAGIEVNRQDDVWFSGYKEDYMILNPDYMWPDAGVGTAMAYGNGSGYTLVSYFGKANYTYDDKYLASLTVRYDGSSRFGKNNRYGTFPSISLGWRLSQEKFMAKTSSWLDDLKLRASWGQTGNQEISNIARYTTYVSNYGVNENGGQSYGTSYDIEGTNGGHTLQSGFKRNQLGNDDIKWETTTQTNLGLDFALFGSKLYGSFDWYFKKTKDILVEMVGIAAMGEGTLQWVNAGEMENRGIELNLGYRNQTNFGLRYDITGNLGTYRNEITKLPATVAANGTFGGNGVKSVIGHPMGAQVGYVADGIFKSQADIDNHAEQGGAGIGRIRWKDLDGDGKITEADQDWIYSPVPDFSYGLNIYLEYKNFDLTMFWQGVQGVDVISDLKKETDIWAGLNIGFLNKGKRLLDAWSQTNPDSDIPALSLSDNNNEKRVSTYWVENGSYLKLRNIQIGYNLPKELAGKLCMDRFRVYLSAQNLLTIRSKNFTGVDPENANFGYPIPVNVTFGINATF